MTKTDTRLDEHFLALSDPTRRAILAQLARGPAGVSALAEPHDMALPSIMGHIKKLEAAGLIVTRKAGRSRICELAQSAFVPTQMWLGQQKAICEGRLDELGAHIVPPQDT